DFRQVVGADLPDPGQLFDPAVQGRLGNDAGLAERRPAEDEVDLLPAHEHGGAAVVGDPLADQRGGEVRPLALRDVTALGNPFEEFFSELAQRTGVDLSLPHGSPRKQSACRSLVLLPPGELPRGHGTDRPSGILTSGLRPDTASQGTVDACVMPTCATFCTSRVERPTERCCSLRAACPFRTAISPSSPRSSRPSCPPAAAPLEC